MNTIDITRPGDPINVTPLDRGEAEALTAEIKQSLHEFNNIGEKLLEAYRRRAWVALDYNNFVDYAQVEFDKSKTEAYRLLNGVRVTSSLFPDFGKEEIKELKPTQSELLLKLPAEQRAQGLREAKELAQAESKKLTAGHIKKVIRQHLGLPEPALKEITPPTEQDGELADLREDWERQAAEIEGLRVQLAEKEALVKSLQKEVLDLMGELNHATKPTPGEIPGCYVERWAVGDRVKILSIQGRQRQSFVGKIGEIREIAFTGLRVKVGGQTISCEPGTLSKLIEERVECQ